MPVIPITITNFGSVKTSVYNDSSSSSSSSSNLISSTTLTNTNPIQQHNNNVHHANFVWYEDGIDQNENVMGNNPYHRYIALSPLLPFGMMLIISTIIFILIIFRRWPGLVAGIVAGCLTSMSIYLLLLTLKEQKLVYE